MTVSVVLVAVLFLQSAPIIAQTYLPEDEIPRPTALGNSMTKLGRGLSNILFCWAEIPVTFDRKLKDGKPLAYLLAVVPVLGTTKAVMRAGTGIYEVFTFPSSGKNNDYGPILEPEYIF